MCFKFLLFNISFCWSIFLLDCVSLCYTCWTGNLLQKWWLMLYPKMYLDFTWSSLCARARCTCESPPGPSVSSCVLIKTKLKQRSQYVLSQFSPECVTQCEYGPHAPYCQASFYHLIYEEILQRHSHAGAWQERFALWSRVTLSVSMVLK